ncbi:juvenile hormone esterase-like isoform X2 [Plodia interpunctella]|uniref:juvenile hormone esterase-like isoform X2 n=1 Tax=Plodia interpunctella TaxID=58824 RepID=UPI0023676182|nr:juvenile hormone esterase-like isoform X2 [Plodia interpunctella]
MRTKADNQGISEPRSAKPWDGVLKATKEKQACIQYNTNIKKGQPLGVHGSEDCLYLNIFTPDLNQNKRAVIVFIYNENFAISYNNTKDYAPDFFIEENVVIATIAHRLSLFGFLSLEDDSVPGNSGLKDIVEGLQWIKNNVDQFGGDPNKITLMGVQGGAAAVDLLIHSEARELFRSAILHSGSALSTTCLQEGARERAFELGEILKFSTSSPTNLLKYLRGVAPVDLLNRNIHASPKDYFKENQRGVSAFGPIVEKHYGGLIIKYPEESSENIISIPIMIGFNSREGLESSLQYLIEPRYLTFVDKDFPLMMPIRLKFRFNPDHEDFYDAIDEIKKKYFHSSKIRINNVAEFVSYIGDVAIAYNVDYAARMYSNKSSAAVFYYHFDYYSNLNENKNNIMKISTVEDGTWGAASGDELCYLFKCPDMVDTYLKNYKSSTKEYKIQNKIVRMWANFAKYGNPTPEEDDLLEKLSWPAFNLDTEQYLHIDKNFDIKSNLYKDRFKFWDKFITKWQNKIKKSNKNDEL